mmetsp:Transcript_5368/g.5501  ORF Transcript_5368/g.5501 Transcript_5368/m.5501 type:complete len:289 (-) Transcript_5368:535-1401(-)
MKRLFSILMLSRVSTSSLYALSVNVRGSSSGIKRTKNIVTIRASDVAAIIGQNQYKTSKEVFDDMWKRHSPETFLGQTKQDLAVEALKSCDETEKVLISATAAYEAKDSDDATVKYQEAEKIIQSSVTLPMPDKVKILDQLKTQVFTSHGIRAESKTADVIEEKEGIILRLDTKLYNFPLGVINGRRYQIAGKIDRVEDIDGEAVIVEIKNRMKRLFNKVPDYEQIQVQTYMQIVNLQVNKVKVIEQYLEETSTAVIIRDDIKWKLDILPKIMNFCNQLDEAMNQKFD